MTCWSHKLLYGNSNECLRDDKLKWLLSTKRKVQVAGKTVLTLLFLGTLAYKIMMKSQLNEARKLVGQWLR